MNTKSGKRALRIEFLQGLLVGSAVASMASCRSGESTAANEGGGADGGGSRPIAHGSDFDPSCSDAASD